jgi:hypothetical protein
MKPQKMISDTLWSRIQEAAKEITDARSEREKQESLRVMTSLLQKEMEIDFGTAW